MQYRMNGAFEQALLNLDEAIFIATHENVPRYQAEIHLEYARLHLAMGDKTKARESLATAKEVMVRLNDAQLAAAVQELAAQLQDKEK
jgi:hypothetical protein